jgi:hypothetical protein
MVNLFTQSIKSCEFPASSLSPPPPAPSRLFVKRFPAKMFMAVNCQCMQSRYICLHFKLPYRPSTRKVPWQELNILREVEHVAPFQVSPRHRYQRAFTAMMYGTRRSEAFSRYCSGRARLAQKLLQQEGAKRKRLFNHEILLPCTRCEAAQSRHGKALSSSLLRGFHLSKDKWLKIKVLCNCGIRLGMGLKAESGERFEERGGRKWIFSGALNCAL